MCTLVPTPISPRIGVTPKAEPLTFAAFQRALPFEFVEESAWNAGTTVPRYNPLNKVPALVMDDGESIYDSRVICEHLDAISGGGLLPMDPARRARVRRHEALGDGMADAGITVFLERKREAASVQPAVLAKYEQLLKVRRMLAVAPINGELCTACHVRLRPAVAQQVRRNEEIITCDSCQRILYAVPKTELTESR